MGLLSFGLRRFFAPLAIGAILEGSALAGDAIGLRSQLNPLAERIDLELEYPSEGAVVSASTCGVFVAGHALVVSGNTDSLDIVVVVDASRSTIQPSGTDINNNGVVGVLGVSGFGPVVSTDPGDSIMAAEIAAARLLLRGLDPRRTRVAVVIFSGDRAIDFPRNGNRPLPRRSAAIIEPLTFDHARIENALSMILASEPSGNTDMAAGLDRATRELLKARDRSAKDDAEKVIVFFTDGQPTLPYGPTKERENILAVFEAARRTAADGIRVHSFAIGRKALEGPIAVIEMAAITGGSFTPVPHPGKLVEMIGDVPIPRLRDVTLRNTTTGAIAQPFRIAADGSWIGFVKLVNGANRLEVSARSENAADSARALTIHLDPSMPATDFPPLFEVHRNTLLEVCLSRQKSLRLSLENERNQRLREGLLREIEHARSVARQKAAVQRKVLEFTIEDPAK